MLRILLLGLVQPIVATLFQTYNDVINGLGCVDPVTPSVFSTYTFSAPTSVQPGTIAIRQIAFQRIGDGAYSNAGILLNGLPTSSYGTCCAVTSCEAAIQYPPWLDGECGLSWCGTENHWEYISFVGTSLHSMGVDQGSSLNLTFVNPMAIVETGGNPIVAVSYTIVPPSSTPSVTGSSSPTQSQTSTQTSSITASDTTTPTQTPSPSSTSSQTISDSPTRSVTSSLSTSPTSSISSSSSQTSSITPTASRTPSGTATTSSSSSITATTSSTPSVTATVSQTPSITSSITSAITSTPSVTSSILPASSSVSVTRSASASPSGICYSVSLLTNVQYVIGNYYYIVPGVNVSQPSGSSFISMGNFVGCSVIGATCKCSYTQGSTVSGCSGKRNSYITYSYGATTGYTYVNESPTCSYNFAATIGIPPSESRTLSPTRSIAATITSSSSLSVSVSAVVTITPTITRSPPQSRSLTPSPTNLGLCQIAQTTFYGQRVTVIGDVTYYITHFINITHQQGTGELFVGSYTSCTETSTACNCNYGPGASTVGCPSRLGYITYRYGTTTNTVFHQQNPSCYYYFFGNIGVSSSPSPSITRTPSGTSSGTLSPTSTPLARPVLIADSTIDFPSVQGENGWYYNYYDGANVLRPLPYYGTSTWTTGGPFWQIQNTVCLISNTYAHPGHTSGCTTTVQGICKPSLFWNNAFPNNTNYVVSYTASLPSIPAGADGVKMTLKGNGLVISNVFPTVNIAQTNYTIYNLSSVELIVDPLTQCHSDKPDYNLKIYQYQAYPSVSSSSTPTPSPSITVSSSQSFTTTTSVSQTTSTLPLVSTSSTTSQTVSPSRTESVSASPSRSESLTPTISPSQTESASPSRSESLTPSQTNSASPSRSESVTHSQTISPTSSETPTQTLSSSPSISNSVPRTLSQTLSSSSSISKTLTARSTSSQTATPSLSQTVTNSPSATSSSTRSQTISSSPSHSWNESATSSPLYYLTPYPSSSATAPVTVTPTPLFLITPWPSNGTLSATSTPLFMKIYYPSVSPIINTTTVYLPETPGTIAMVSLGVGILSVATIGLAVRQILAYRNAPKPATDPLSLPLSPPQQQQQQQQESSDTNCQIEISTSDLQEIQELLRSHNKKHRVL
jgi:hypothetical protein